MKPRRPSSFLFVSAILGAYCGGDIISFSSSLLAMALFFIAFFIFRTSFVEIGTSLLFIFFFVSAHTAFVKENFRRAVSSIPDDVQAYSGVIKDAYQKENGMKIAIVRTSLPDHPEINFIVKLYLVDALAAHDPQIGQAIRFLGKIIPYQKNASPVHFDAARYGLVHNVHGSLTLSQSSSMWLFEIKEHFYFASFRMHFRKLLQKALSPREASLLLALTVGDTNLFSSEQNEIYQSIGAQHLLAVSGLQISLLSFTCFLALFSMQVIFLPTSFFRYSYPATCVLTIVFIFFIVGLAGFSSSAIRAFLMTTVILSQPLIMRELDLLDALFISGLVTLLFLPVSLFDLGFLLSYAAVFGILLAHERSAFMRKKIREKSVVLRYLFPLLISSIAVFLATLPVLVFHSNTFAPLGLLANFFLVPIASMLQIPAILGGLFGALLDWPILFHMAAYFSNAIEIMAQFLSEIMGIKTYMPYFSTTTLASLALGIFLLFLTLLKPGRLILGSALLLLAGPIARSVMIKKDAMHVVVMAIGQGDATLFSLPSGHALLVDAGGEAFKDFDPGQKIVVPRLKQEGIKKLDVLVISHPDPDHIKGAFAVIDEIPIKEIWHNGFSSLHPLQKQLLLKAAQKNIVVKSTKDLLGSHVFGNTEVQVLAPQVLGDENYFSEQSTNDNSLVLRIIHEKQALLWPGDIEYFSERLLLTSNLDLSSVILKAPHHGSKTSSSSAFIERVNPDHVIYSTGENNRYNFPHSQITKRYEDHGVKAWNTAQLGEIVITIKKDKILIDGFRMPFKEKT